MEQLGIDFNATGSVMSKTELEELRRKRGECITCGRKCFQKRLFKMIPITDHGRVLNGRCLNCKPLDATENGLIPAVSRPATKEDLARFSRSQSNLGLGGGRSPSRRASSGRTLSGGEPSSRSVASSSSGAGRPPGRSLSHSSASAANASSLHLGADSGSSGGGGGLPTRGRSSDSQTMDTPASRGPSASSSSDPARRERSITPSNSSRHVAAPQAAEQYNDGLESSSGRGYASADSRRRLIPHPGLEATSVHSLDRRDQRVDPGDPYGDALETRSVPHEYGVGPPHDYNAGRQAVSEELHHAVEQMGIYPDEQPLEHPPSAPGQDDFYQQQGHVSQRSFVNHGDQPPRQRVTRQYSGESGPVSAQRHGMLDRGGELSFNNSQSQFNEYNSQPPPPNNHNNSAAVTPSSVNNARHMGSSRTMDSMSSVEDDLMNGRGNASKRFVPPNHALYEDEQIESNSMRSGGTRSVVNEDDERALDRLHAANGDCAEILAVMRDYLGSTLVQSYSLKELSCLHLGPGDQDVLAHHGAMDLIAESMHTYPEDVELQIHGCRAVWNGSGTPENQVAFVDAGALDIILADMDRFMDNNEVQECAMGTLSNLAAAEANLLKMVEKGTVGRVVEAMNKHSDNKMVQSKGCSAITNMASHLSPLKKDIMDMGGGGAVVICMVMHPDDFDLQEKALRALKNLSSNNDENKVELANIGGIDAVITAMQVHRDQPGVQEAGAWTLSNLASNNDNKAVIGDCGGIDVVIRAMWVHSDNVKVQEWCCRALYTLTLDRHNSGMVLQVGGISAVVNAMQAHVDSGAVQEMGCAVLCNLAFDESSKMRIVDEEALDAIVLAMVLYSEDAKVQESACEVLLQLAIVENFKSMQASNIGELARAAAAKFPENCKEPAFKLLHVLEGYCEQY
ncbi:expressed unknown protein [Seminavis robusta]|uniref:LRRK2 ARM repeat domain-containing protein n=1 Tax=Seminavis robusta TaxID=568900 RepID=A0A9N8HHM8_9STRA|nr:expressed unknown protein [Seminavis robusta]|eukprot:Sro545_g163850.2  (908) ;mRNA; r:22353-25076